jgi:DNA-directed RNA polymerase I, II, and III subunit RPABC3
MQILKEIFVVKEIDMVPTKINNLLVKVKNKIFSKVSRIFAISNYNKTELTIDINTEIYDIHEEDNLEVLLIKSTLTDEKNNYGNRDWIEFFGKELIDLYEYVMHGMIFHTGADGQKYFVYASFGGLLMKIFGKLDGSLIKDLNIDSEILILIRKI